MIKREEKHKGRREAHEALERAKALVKKRLKNKDTAGPFYKDGCVIYCSKDRVEEVLEKYNIDNDEPMKRVHQIFKKKEYYGNKKEPRNS